MSNQKMTKSDISRQAEKLGVNTRTLTRRESGEHLPKHGVVDRIFQICNEGASDAPQWDGRGQPPHRTSDGQKGRHTGSEGLEIGDSEQTAKIDMAEMGGEMIERYVKLLEKEVERLEGVNAELSARLHKLLQKKPG